MKAKADWRAFSLANVISRPVMGSAKPKLNARQKPSYNKARMPYMITTPVKAYILNRPSRLDNEIASGYKGGVVNDETNGYTDPLVRPKCTQTLTP